MEVDKVRLEKFKQNLSPFAQKVLEKWLAFKTENACIINVDRPSYTTYENTSTKYQSSNRKVIVFKDFPSNLSACQISDEGVNHFADTAENISHISTSEELLSPVAIPSNHQVSGSTAHTQQYDATEAPTVSHDIVRYDLEKKLSVNWDDFLAEDFFDNLDSMPQHVHEEKDENKNLHEDKHDDKLDITFNTERLINSEAKEEPLKHNECGPIMPPKSKKSVKSKSRKTQKIEKRIHESTQGFRKQKYTKAVKNWLKDVDNNIDASTVSGKTLDENNPRNDETKKKKGKEVYEKVKKTVQAQLANMGGVMRFAKPKPDGSKGELSNNHLPTLINDFIPPTAAKTCNKVKEKSLPKERKRTDEPESTETVKVKEKKTRSKFVAPVLTPLPVKDVTFEIHVLDQQMLGNDLFSSENTEIAMILVYSTGFNQLNCQYASSAGVPEGLMFGVRDQYYYVHDFTIVSEEAMSRVISSNTLICFNAKEVLIFLMERYDLSSCSYSIIDLKIGASLLNPDEPPDSFSKLQKFLGRTSQYSIASDCPLQKCARYIGLLRECDGNLRGMLADAGMWQLFSDVEMQALPVIAEMEHHGICINEDHLKELDATLEAHIKEVELRCYEAAGRRFQISSALQVRNIVYGELKLDERCNVAVRETVGKAKSTSEAMLRLLMPVHPLPALVLQYRQLHKARATFVAGILQHARRSVVRPTWEQNAAVTGRVACSSPNLQAIPSNHQVSGSTAHTQQYDATEAPTVSHDIVRYDLEKKLSVNWDDFLAEDFFDNLDSMPQHVHEEKDENKNLHEDKHDDKLDITFNTERLINSEAKEEPLKHNECGPIMPPKSKKSVKSKSRKTQKIEKRIHESTQGFRKQKYTKAVKNWLKDVDNNIDASTVSGKTLDENNPRNDETKKKKGKEVYEKVKKTVQAQLANMGGVMRFAKPKPDGSKGELSNNHLPTLINDFIPPTAAKTCNKVKEKSLPKERKRTDEPESTETVKVKEKKTRSKFVAPVLTPLPVKDVTFEIHVLDQQMLGNDLFSSENTEIAMILVYSTGFNQLNCQYASSAGVPEGLMFGVRDQYYYVHDFTIVSEEAMSRVISSNTLICFNAKEVLIFLMERYDLSSCSYSIIDLKIGASLLNPDEPPDSFSKLQKFLGRTSQYSIASDCPLQKCARYIGLLRECDGNLRGMLADAGMWQLFSDVEMQALPVIAEMEHHGICINEDHLKELDATLEAHIKEVELRCYEAAGRRFQISSALQVRNIVYGELKLDERCNVAVRETVGKAKSTSEAMLRLLMPVHPLPALVLQYRQLHKARATFVAGILQHARRSVVRPTWEQNAAVTGRVACSSPNLQAVPRSFSLAPYSEQEGDEPADAVSLSFRGAFVARAGRVLLAADFRHAECRVLALAAADRALGAALASQDLFSVLAAQWLRKAEAGVSAEERERTKRLVYACVYGAGARTLADILRLSGERASAAVDSFHKSFPGLRRFGADVVRAAAARGGRLCTPGGRARSLPQLASDDRAARAHAERQAVNFIVQGSAADLCKAAMVRCGAALRRAGLAARALLQIHDELVWELPPRQLPAAAKIIKSAMEGCGALVGLPAAFPVRLSAGPSWGDLAPYPV